MWSFVIVCTLLGVPKAVATTQSCEGEVPLAEAPLDLPGGDFPLISNGSYLYFDEKFLEAEEATKVMEELKDSLPWDWTYYEIDGEQVRGPRKMAWFADGADWNYKFSQNHVPGLPVCAWTPTLLKIKERLEKLFGPLNSVLANLYENGKEHSAWHSDNDPWLGYPEANNIPSVSFGYPREFVWRPKANKDEVSSTILTHGSLVVMGGHFQKDFQHSIPQTNSTHDTYRINLTFRQIKHPKREPAKEFWHS